jgi:RNA polymerase sigma-70 factor (ECF subfamily)
MTPEDPIQLIKQIVDKDEKAFERFYDRFAALVYSLALRILRNKVDAEELTQDVFLRVWREAVNYQASRGPVEAWLITMTRSRGIDKLRSLSRKNKNTQSLDDCFDIEDTAQSSAPAEARLTIGGLLGEISDVQRSVLELAYFEGLSQSEIAVRLDLPLGTVKTRVRDGLKHLRELLEKKEKKAAL